MKRVNYKAIWPIVGMLGLDVILFGSTDATAVPSFIIIVGFLALVATLWMLWYGVFSLLGVYGIHLRRKRRFALYMSALTGSIVALQSIGELSKRDIVVLLPLVVLGYLYSVYVKTDRRNFDA